MNISERKSDRSGVQHVPADAHPPDAGLCEAEGERDLGVCSHSELLGSFLFACVSQSETKKQTNIKT